MVYETYKDSVFYLGGFKRIILFNDMLLKSKNDLTYLLPVFFPSVLSQVLQRS